MSTEQTNTNAGNPTEPAPDQGSPDARTPTGARSGPDPSDLGQQGELLTTAQGARLRDSDTPSRPAAAARS